jgi:hypothetical protein
MRAIAETDSSNEDTVGAELFGMSDKHLLRVAGENFR